MVRDLLARYRNIDLEVPLDDEEVEEILADAGIDPEAALRRLMVKVNEALVARREPRDENNRRNR